MSKSTGSSYEIRNRHHVINNLISILILICNSYFPLYEELGFHNAVCLYVIL
jgi:hypothetical protein